MLALVFLLKIKAVTDYTMLDGTLLELLGIITLALTPMDRYYNSSFQTPHCHW